MNHPTAIGDVVQTRRPKKKKVSNRSKKIPLTKMHYDETKKIAKRRRLSQKSACKGPQELCAINGSPTSNALENQKSIQSLDGPTFNFEKTLKQNFIIDLGTSPTFTDNYMSHNSSLERAKAAMSWILAPVGRKQFYQKYFEKCPFVVRRNNSAYYGDLFSTANLDQILHQNDVYFGRNIDITSYRNQLRETHNPQGRATPAHVWRMYSEGCSVRLLNPQTYIDSVHSLCGTLAEEFCSFVGANVYLTPGGTQGFAPHWDDIDAFVMQLEGVKEWRVYAPRSAEETLPLESSPNLSRDELGEPLMRTVLNPGDLLYMPRGFIHEAYSCTDVHSLHITVSVNQRNTWSDFFRLLLPATLDLVTAEDVEFRRTLPRDFLLTMGSVNSDSDTSEKRQRFLATANRLFAKLISSAPIDAAADQMGKKFVHDSLPPYLPVDERMQLASYRTRQLRSTASPVPNNKHVNVMPSLPSELVSDSLLRLVTKTVCRIAVEGDEINLYYSADNTRTYHEHEEAFYFELTAEKAEITEHLIERYPSYTKISAIPSEVSIEETISYLTMLYDKGLLQVK